MIAVIPAYEPNESFEKIASELKVLDYKVVVVDDGSLPDKQIQFDRIKKYAIVLRHTKNRGKGRAIKTALEFIRDNMPDENGIVTVDADGQHKISDVKKVCGMLALHKNELILGVRDFKGKIPFRSKFGNALTKAVFALVSGRKLSDTQTGLRAFSTDMIPFLLGVSGERYEYEMNVLLSCAESGIGWTEVPICAVYLDNNSSSHFKAIADSIRIYKSILKFTSSSFASFLLDYILFNFLNIVLGTIPNFNAVFFSNITARAISCCVNYQLNKKYVFHSEGGALSAAKYMGLALGILFVNTALVQAAAYIGMPAFAAKILAEIILFVCSMLVQRFFVFKPANKSH